MNTLTPGSKIRVLIVDDSAFMRAALSRMIASDPGLEVVATAQSGFEALEKVVKLKPHVVTLDVEMPGLNGLEILKRIMRDCPLPVIMVSSLTQEGAETALEALDLGAFDYVPKRHSFVSLDIVKVRDDLINKIKAAAGSRVGPHYKAARAVPVAAKGAPSADSGTTTIVVIGTSTGGPRALQDILPTLPADLPVGVLVVQHMPIGFTTPFAKRLDNLCQVAVHEAENGTVIQKGHVYIAPAARHMTVCRRSSSEVALQVSPNPSNTLHIPSVDITMLSVAEAYRALAMGIIMTGMGADGAQGMQAIFKAGGLTVGQDEASCVVYGMPRSCAEMGILKRVVALADIPKQILSAVGYHAPREVCAKPTDFSQRPRTRP